MPASPPSSAYTRLWRSPPPYASPASVRSLPSAYDSDTSNLSLWSLSSQSTLRRPSARQRRDADDMLVEAYPPLVPTPSPPPPVPPVLAIPISAPSRPSTLPPRPPFVPDPPPHLAPSVLGRGMAPLPRRRKPRRRRSTAQAKGAPLEDRLTDRYSPTMAGRRVLIGPLKGVSSTELASLLLSRVGPVRSLTVDHRGNAIVQFEFSGTAEDARKKLHGLTLDEGNRISVVVLPENEREERERKRPRLPDRQR